MDKNLLGLIIVVLLMIVAFALVITWLYWPELREAQLTARRHKDYDLRLQSLSKDKSASISTPIKSQNDRDYSCSFERW